MAPPSRGPRPGDRLQVEVTGLDARTGLGRAEGPAGAPAGATVAVEDGLPGEGGEVLVTRPGRRLQGRLVRRTSQAAPERRPPPCPRWTAESPCRLMHLAPPAQGAVKRRRLTEALAAGGVTAPVADTVAAPRTLGWRARATYVAARDRSGRLVLGAYRRGTHLVQPMAARCPLEEPALAEVAAAFEAALETLDVPVADPGLPVVPDDGCGAPRSEPELAASLSRGRPHDRTPRLDPEGVRYLVLRSGRAGEVVAAVLTPGGGLPDGTAEALDAEVRRRTPRLAGLWVGPSGPGDVLFGAELPRPVADARPLAEPLGGLTFEVGPAAFFQVNREAAEVLHALAVEAAGSGPAVDVYAGVGAMSLRLAQGGGPVVAIESNPAATHAAVRSAERNGLDDRLRVLTADAAEGLRTLKAEGLRPAAVVLNPPRKGCAPEVLEGAARLSPDRIVYVSCGPESLGRDLARLEALGYATERVTPVDLFPQSEHVEAVVRLTR